MRIVYTKIAQEDLANVKDYLKSRNPIAYKNLWFRFNEIFALLSDNPYVGALGRLKHTKEFFITNTNYYIVYHINNTKNQLEILNILHTKRKY